MRNENFLPTHIGRAKCSHCPAVALSYWHFRFYIFNVNQYTKVTIRLKRPIRMVIPAHMSCRDHVIYFGLSNSEGNLIVNCGIQFRVDEIKRRQTIFSGYFHFIAITRRISHTSHHTSRNTVEKCDCNGFSWPINCSTNFTDSKCSVPRKWVSYKLSTLQAKVRVKASNWLLTGCILHPASYHKILIRNWAYPSKLEIWCSSTLSSSSYAWWLSRHAQHHQE